MMLLAVVLSQVSLCPPGWEPLSTPGCFKRGAGPGVIVYLHGMMAPNEKLFSRELGFIAPAAKKADVTVIALRGTAGLCDWAAEYKQWWCWPTVKSREADTTAIVDRVNTAVSEVETRLSRTLPAPLLVGYSNGGYFTSLLMEPERLSVTGFVVMHGGLVTGVTIGERPKPTLLIAAEGDTIQRPAMETFRAALEQRQWSPAFVLRKKEHPLELEDFEHVMSFARRLSWRERPKAMSAPRD